MTSGLRIKHNIEVAHRLFLLPGKCEAIHGHSMWVQLDVVGDVDPKTGILEGLDFGTMKRAFRGYLDSEFDHRLLLNKEDEWAQPLKKGFGDPYLPGLRACDGDPTTENIARWIAEWATAEYADPSTGITEIGVMVNETHVNSAFHIIGRDS